MADNSKSRAVLHPTALRANGADYLRTYHQISVAHDVTLEDVLRPGFYANHVDKLRVNDLIDILADDGGMDVQVRVTGKGTGMVQVRPLRVWLREDRASAPVDPDETAASDDEVPEGYVVNFAPKQKWRVMTRDPHAIIHKDVASKAEAIDLAVKHSAMANGL